MRTVVASGDSRVRAFPLLACLLAAALLAVPGAGARETAAPASAVAGAQPFNWDDAVIYFVIVDRFADGDPKNNVAVDTAAKGTFHGGDLKGLREQIDEIASLGITAIWITPVVKNIDGFVTGAGFPDWGYHGYWADDFTRLDPRFGTEEDLKALVDACHRKGIKVLLDVVYNHAGYNSRYLTDPKTKTWFRSNDLGTCGQDDVTSCVAGLPDFKTELPEVDEYLLSAHLGLAKRAGVDGFRLDTVKHVSHDFWKLHRQRTRETLGEDFFLLGETWGGDPQVLDPWFAGDEMDAGFDFSFQGSVVSFLLGRGRVVAFDRYLKSREKTRAGYHVAQFLSSHDVTGALTLLGGDKALFRLAAVLELTSLGIPVVYYGEEVGRGGGEWPENRSNMPWGSRPVKPGSEEPRDEGLRADYQKLIGIRRSHPALSRGVHAGVVTTEQNAYVFLRRDAAAQDVVVVAMNRGADPVTVEFAVPEEWAQATAVKDILNGESVAIAAGTIEMPLYPKAARILAVK